jgi:hypothetical protein
MVTYTANWRLLYKAEEDLALYPEYALIGHNNGVARLPRPVHQSSILVRRTVGRGK